MSTTPTVQAAAKFCHIQIPAPDLKKAREFYTRLFGWTVQDNVPGPKYWFFSDGSCGGAFDADVKPSGENTGVMFFIGVADMEAALKNVPAFGGRVDKPRRQISPDIGYDAYITDPNGVRLGLFSKA